MTSKKAFLLLALIGFIVYANSLGNGFVMDIQHLIENTDVAKDIDNIPKFFIQSGTPPTERSPIQSYYRPLSLSTYPLLYVLFNGSALAFQLTRISIHIFNAFLLYLFGKKILSQRISILISIIFLIHPLNVEPTHFSIEDLLSFMLGISSLLVLSRKKPSYVIFSLLLIMSLLSKETGVLFGIIAPLFVYIFHGFKEVKKAVLFSLITVFLYTLLRFIASSTPNAISASVSPSPMMLAPLYERLISIPKILAHYIIVSFFPFRLVVGHTWVVRALTLSEVIVPFFLVAGVVSVLLMYLKRLSGKKEKILYVTLFFWITVGFGIHSQIFPIDVTVADRFMYFILPGILFLTGFIIQKEQKIAIKYKNVFVTMLLVLLIFFSIRVMVRNTNWKDNYSIYSHDVRYVENNWAVFNGYGDELFKRGDIDEAEKQFQKSVKSAPHEAVNWTNLATVHALKGDTQKAKTEYEKAIKNNPSYYKAYEAYGYVLLNSGDLSNAEKFLVGAVEKFPNQPQLFIFLAQTQLGLEKFDDAAISAKKVYDLVPSPQNFQIYQQFQNKASDI